MTGHVSLPPNVYQPILQGLEGVPETGTASKEFQGFPFSTFQIAGKTGTADVGLTKEPNAWFVAFGPIPNPQYVVAVVVGQAGYGAQAAAPAVRQIFDYLIANPIKPVSLPTAAKPPSSTLPAAAPPVSTGTTTTSTP